MLALDFEHVLSPHAGLLGRGIMERFLDGLTDEALTIGSRPEPALDPGKRMYSCHPTPDTTFVFDADKLPASLSASNHCPRGINQPLLRAIR